MFSQWKWQLSHHLSLHAALGRGSPSLAGDGSQSEDASGQLGCVEGRQPLDWRFGVYQPHGVLHHGLVLQRAHGLGSLVFGSVFAVSTALGFVSLTEEFQ